MPEMVVDLQCVEQGWFRSSEYKGKQDLGRVGRSHPFAWWTPHLLMCTCNAAGQERTQEPGPSRRETCPFLLSRMSQKSGIPSEDPDRIACSENVFPICYSPRHHVGVCASLYRA